MNINDMTDEQKWAELGRMYVLTEQTHNNIAMLKQALSKKEESDGKDIEDTPSV